MSLYVALGQSVHCYMADYILFITIGGSYLLLYMDRSLLLRGTYFHCNRGRSINYYWVGILIKIGVGLLITMGWVYLLQ